MIRIEAFESRDALTDACAEAIGERLAEGGLFVATGGSTPGPVYDRLARQPLPWDGITVTLSDERRVATDSELSNERLVRERLLVGRAAAARFVALDDASLPRLLPAAVTVLGMGPDGHVASLFPGGPELADGLGSDRLTIPVAMSGLAPFVPRLSMTLHALLQTALIILLVTGEDKRALIERIEADGTYSPPAAAVLRQDRCPVRVMWAA
jgi:6-phosphogluconolactonase